jgi:hypothetical protein
MSVFYTFNFSRSLIRSRVQITITTKRQSETCVLIYPYTLRLPFWALVIFVPTHTLKNNMIWYEP